MSSVLSDLPSEDVGQPAGAEPPRDPPGSLTRRSFLHRSGLVAGTVLVVAAGGLSYRAYDRGVFETGEGGAYDAWDTWEHGAGSLALVSAAVLAANPHNSQAWVFRAGPSSIDVFADRARSTGSVDPFSREMEVGLGAALENLMQAAPAHGFRATLAVLPTPADPVHAARVDLAPGPRRRSALYEAIPRRHTDRSPYRAKAVPPAVLARMTALAGDLANTRVSWFTSEADRSRIGGLMVAAAQAITRDEQQSRDSFRLFRASWDDIQKYKDGLTLDTQGLSEMTTAIAKLLPPSTRSAGDTFWVDKTRDTQTRTAAAYGVVAVPDSRDGAQRITGGRLLERIHLWAAANGIALQHMNQITERADRERQLGLPPRFTRASRSLVPEAGWEQLVAFRVGYAQSDAGQRKSPRRPATAVTA